MVDEAWPAIERGSKPRNGAWSWPLDSGSPRAGSRRWPACATGAEDSVSSRSTWRWRKSGCGSSPRTSSRRKEYLRRWTLTVIERVLASLRAEFASKEKTRLFDSLKGFLVGDASSDPYRGAAQELSLTAGARRVAVHRLRRQFRDRLRAEIAPTVGDAGAVEDELRSLLASLS